MKWIYIKIAGLFESGLAQKEIVMGTAFAVWSGIMAADTFLFGIWPISLA